MFSSPSTSSSFQTMEFDGSDTDDGGGNALSRRPAAARIASRFRSQKPLVALCKKHGVDTKEFAPVPAGDRRACSPPPAGAVCVYADALEAGMRVPLHPFFRDVLSHFGVAPSQLAPNAWRIMAGFLELSRSAGVQHPPPVSVFRHFFALQMLKFKGWYCFKGRDPASALFTGLPRSIKGWKEGFFFLVSRTPWPCPVLWGEPTKSATAAPVLTSQQRRVALKLLRARGATAVDLRVYICETNIPAEKETPCAPAPRSRRPTAAKGRMDASTYSMLQNLRAEKDAAARASTEEVLVKSEPGGSDTPLLCRKKRRPVEDGTEHGLRRSELTSRGSVPGACACAPPGFYMPRDRKPRLVPDCHDGDTADLEAARQLLQGIVTPSRERAFTAAKPSDVIDSTYIAILQAANYASFSLDHARRLQDDLDKSKAELVEAKKAAAAEVERVKAAAAADVERAKAAAVQEFLDSETYERRLMEEALKGYERGMDDMKRVALRLRPDLDADRLFVPPGEFQ